MAFCGGGRFVADISPMAYRGLQCLPPRQLPGRWTWITSIDCSPAMDYRQPMEKGVGGSHQPYEWCPFIFLRALRFRFEFASLLIFDENPVFGQLMAAALRRWRG